jgi:hypothetical protein
MPLPYVDCMILVAQLYALPPRVLPAIQAVEGGRVGEMHPNADGSTDLGVMQVNTRWVGPLAHFTKLSEDAVRARLVSEPCFNIAAAGAIMRTYLNEAHGDLLRAVAYYHSHTPVRGTDYRIRVEDAAVRLFERHVPAGSTADAAPNVTAAASQSVAPQAAVVQPVAMRPTPMRPTPMRPTTMPQAAMRPVSMHAVAAPPIAPQFVAQPATVQHVAVRHITIQPVAIGHTWHALAPR